MNNKFQDLLDFLYLKQVQFDRDVDTWNTISMFTEIVISPKWWIYYLVNDVKIVSNLVL